MIEMTKINLESIREKINNLYRFRDEYFVNNSNENEWPNKRSAIEMKIKEINDELENYINTNHLDDDDNNMNNKAEYYFLRGWLLNIRDQYDTNVFESLTKSIKFQPDNQQAWLELGECYFKKQQLNLAKNCFEKVLQINPLEKHALRNLSIMLRSNQCNTNDQSLETKQQNIVKSIELAKKAIEYDCNDPDSWAILGNAYLTLFFQSSNNKSLNRIDLLEKCKSSYQKALNDPIVRTKSDILYNFSTILQYDEEFEQSLQCLYNASRYDSEWLELIDKKQRLLNLFDEICNGNKLDRTVIKAKKLANIKEQLQTEELKLKKQFQNELKFFNGQTKLIDELNVNEINDCLLVCRIISYIADPHNIFFSSIYIIIDSNGQTITLFVYDLIRNKGPRPGDTLIIIKPFLREYRIKFNGQEFHFKALRIVDPLQEMLINNMQIKNDCLAIPTINVTLKSD
ncbi:tetratricopeptide repeat protein 5-like isoform X1 [Dermatophagoides pteronyssinus]|uniref:tetratricopeptide repeat protein 5-like isoform X1 n=1 Tax=Dermatophagoides pteronyssinus TaxID=6956 RepID=UPI003F66E40F